MKFSVCDAGHAACGVERTPHLASPGIKPIQDTETWPQKAGNAAGVPTPTTRLVSLCPAPATADHFQNFIEDA